MTDIHMIQDCNMHLVRFEILLRLLVAEPQALPTVL